MNLAPFLAKTLKLARNLAPFPCQKFPPYYWQRVLHFSLPKICTLLSPLLKGAEFTLSFAIKIALSLRNSSRSSFCFCQMACQGIEAPKQTIEFPAVLLLIEKTNQIINTNNYWKEKKRFCVRLRSEDKHHFRKSADRKAQISALSGTNAFLICAFQSADFLRWCLSSERNLTHNLFFYFQ